MLTQKRLFRLVAEASLPPPSTHPPPSERRLYIHFIKHQTPVTVRARESTPMRHWKKEPPAVREETRHGKIGAKTSEGPPLMSVRLVK